MSLLRSQFSIRIILRRYSQSISFLWSLTHCSNVCVTMKNYILVLMIHVPVALAKRRRWPFGQNKRKYKTTSMETVSTGVLDKNKEHYSRDEDKAKKIIWCINTYTIAFVKIQTKWRFTIHYVKPTAPLLFKRRFLKSGTTYRRQVVISRHQTPQGQSVVYPEKPLPAEYACDIKWADGIGKKVQGQNVRATFPVMSIPKYCWWHVSSFRSIVSYPATFAWF